MFFFFLVGGGWGAGTFFCDHIQHAHLYVCVRIRLFISFATAGENLPPALVAFVEPGHLR